MLEKCSIPSAERGRCTRARRRARRRSLVGVSARGAGGYVCTVRTGKIT